MQPPLYSPLPGTRSIRLLIIEPGYPKDDLKCSFDVIDNIDTAPRFEALSYAWQSTHGHVRITLNNHPMTVTKNLAAALRRLRPLPPASLVRTLTDSERRMKGDFVQHDDGLSAQDNAWATFAHRRREETLEERAVRLPLWVDAVCINEADVNERSQQVQFMRCIYERAERVLIWLGDGPQEDVAATLTIISQALINLESEWRAAGDAWNGVTREEPYAGLRSAHGFMARQGSSSMDAQRLRLRIRTDFFWPRKRKDMSELWERMNMLLSRTGYFTRIWIIQEVTVARRAVVLAGEFVIEWQALGVAAFWLESKGYTERCPSLREVAFLWECCMSRETRQPILQLVRKTLRHAFSEPRDRVYALLGLAVEGIEAENTSGFIKVDYSSHEEDVYRNITRSLIENHGSLEALSLISHKVMPPNSYPSWVPAWHQPANPLPAAYRRNKEDSSQQIYKASHGLLPSSASQITGNYLTKIEVIRCGIISFTSEAIGSRADGAVLRETWSALTESTSTRQYPTGENPVNAFLLACTAGVTATLEDARSNLEYMRTGFQWASQYVAFGKGVSPTLPPSSWIAEVLGKLPEEEWYTSALACIERCFFLTEDGYLGLSPPCAEEGDVLVVVLGVEVPFVLRPTDKRGEFRLVGEAYVHGLMDGEAVKQVQTGSAVVEIVSLR